MSGNNVGGLTRVQGNDPLLGNNGDKAFIQHKGAQRTWRVGTAGLGCVLVAAAAMLILLAPPSAVLFSILGVGVTAWTIGGTACGITGLVLLIKSAVSAFFGNTDIPYTPESLETWEARAHPVDADRVPSEALVRLVVQQGAVVLSKEEQEGLKAEEKIRLLEENKRALNQRFRKIDRRERMPLECMCIALNVARQGVPIRSEGCDRVNHQEINALNEKLQALRFQGVAAEPMKEIMDREVIPQQQLAWQRFVASLVQHLGKKVRLTEELEKEVKKALEQERALFIRYKEGEDIWRGVIQTVQATLFGKIKEREALSEQQIEKLRALLKDSLMTFLREKEAMRKSLLIRLSELQTSLKEERNALIDKGLDVVRTQLQTIQTRLDKVKEEIGSVQDQITAVEGGME